MPWSDEVLNLVRPVRDEVFVREQNVPLELEWGGEDAKCVHAVARNDADEVIGTARMFPDGHIGRLAVLSGWRERGVGSALMRAMLDEAAHRGIKGIYLHAQIRAIGFYERFGLRATGEIFMDAGIAHRLMIMK